MISTATAAVKAAGRPPAPVPSQKPRVATARAITTGTKTPETRSASRCTRALPFWASSTRRAIWASWVSAPTRVAATTSRPPALTVAPTTASPGPTSTGTDSPVSIEASTAEVPSLDDAVGGDLLAGPDDEPVADGELLDRDRASSRAVAQHGDVLGAELEQGPQGGAGAALGAGLEVAAGQEEQW